ncbi:ParB N-terminal domain-containing protein [Paenibacillus durus]|uniref:Chromosome partitioning protein ParB n=1 Tax=Paenibacillus durus TaxID=44251 RepID=A0A089HSS5_PAEDU|nr:ParB N-terminal domain-containing protein [Paenibacillus durus]AIQ13795.1 chromosome partitioning protein ParB [Paenibacillus durus]
MATTKRMVPKLGSIDELLKLSEQSFKEPDAMEPAKGGIQSIPICKIRFFQDHPFHLYEGERLSDMADSIVNNGVLVPVIVRKIETDENGCEYEMLAGHNRMNAALLIGLEQLPSIVKEKLTDEEALMYVVETNVLQRSFADMLPSEKAKVLSLRYSDMFSQGKRNDIILELKKLENPQYDKENSTSAPLGQKLTSREKVAYEYGLSQNSVSRLLRIDKLIPELKQRTDHAELPLRSAVHLSYLTEEEQKMVETAISEQGYKLDMKKSERLQDYSGKLTVDQVSKILSGEAIRKPRGQPPAPFKLKHKVYAKYFSPQSKAAEVEEIIDKALEMYFAHQRQQHPQSHEEAEDTGHVPDF